MLPAIIDPDFRSRGADSASEGDPSDGGGETADGDSAGSGSPVGQVTASIRVLSEEDCCFSARVSPPRGGRIISESNEYVREGELVRVDFEGVSYFAQNLGTELLGHTARMDLQVDLGPFPRVP